jgi:hypothetical protein
MLCIRWTLLEMRKEKDSGLSPLRGPYIAVLVYLGAELLEAWLMDNEIGL